MKKVLPLGGLRKKSAHGIYVSRAKSAHPIHKPVTRNTFFGYLLKADQVKIAYGRGGRRAANAAKAPTEESKREIRGTLPFELATLDHYKADIFLVLAVANGKIYSFRPWISALMDICTGDILASWFSFHAPSTPEFAGLSYAVLFIHFAAFNALIETHDLG